LVSELRTQLELVVSDGAAMLRDGHCDYAMLTQHTRDGRASSDTVENASMKILGSLRKRPNCDLPMGGLRLSNNVNISGIVEYGRDATATLFGNSMHVIYFLNLVEKTTNSQGQIRFYTQSNV